MTKHGSRKMYVCPFDVNYSQNTISNSFSDGRLIGKTLDDIVTMETNVTDIPAMRIVDVDGQFFTRNNRRLWVFRQLFHMKLCVGIPVEVARTIPQGQFTTDTGGHDVLVRGQHGSKQLEQYQRTERDKHVRYMRELARCEEEHRNRFSVRRSPRFKKPVRRMGVHYEESWKSKKKRKLQATALFNETADDHGIVCTPDGYDFDPSLEFTGDMFCNGSSGQDFVFGANGHPVSEAEQSRYHHEETPSRSVQPVQNHGTLDRPALLSTPDAKICSTNADDRSWQGDTSSNCRDLLTIEVHPRSKRRLGPYESRDKENMNDRWIRSATYGRRDQNRGLSGRLEFRENVASGEYLQQPTVSKWRPKMVNMPVSGDWHDDDGEWLTVFDRY